MEKVKIFDTTLRDGEQSPGATMNSEQKLEIAKQLARLNVDIIEAGFPISSNDDLEAVKQIAREVRKPVIAGLARCIKGDIDACWKAVQHAKKPRIHIFLATSPIHMKYKLKMSPAEIINRGVWAVKYANSLCDDVEFSPEDASRTKPNFLYDVVEKVIEAGAKTVNIPDTVGYAIPDEFGSLIKGIKENVKNIDDATISVHCHNDLGLAVSNSLEAIRNGARQVECTINGIGERAGNASLEEIVMALRTRRDFFNFTTGIDTRQIYKTSNLVSNITGILVQPNKAVVGKNAFAHEAGIHQHGVLSHAETYEIMNPKTIGRETDLVIGKHSGKHSIKRALNAMGYGVTGQQLLRIVERIKELADKQKILEEYDIIAIADDVLGQLSNKEQRVILEDISVITGKKVTPTATVKLKINGKQIISSASGVGPVDAAYSAINKALSEKLKQLKLVDYSLKAITGGTNALADVTIRLKDSRGKLFNARALNEDIIMASVLAYIKGANRALENKK